MVPEKQQKEGGRGACRTGREEGRLGTADEVAGDICVEPLRRERIDEPDHRGRPRLDGGQTEGPKEHPGGLDLQPGHRLRRFVLAFFPAGERSSLVEDTGLLRDAKALAISSFAYL